ncbi:MAG: cytochrome c biogenesis protein ResB [Nitriliruptoraceae bacterium]
MAGDPTARDEPTGEDAIESQPPPRMNPAVRRRSTATLDDGVLRFVLASVAMGWRWLVRMRTALILLGVLGLMTAIATAVPQAPNVPGTVESWLAGDEGPGAGVSEFLWTIGAFDVYGSPAFLALLLALFLSLTACLIPRIRAWVRLVRHSQPPLLRFETGAPLASFEVDAERDDVLDAGESLLREGHWRVRTSRPDDAVTPQVVGEKGLWSREGGSLVFHLSFYVLLAAIVFGQLVSFEGQRGVIEGEPGFADTEVSYWTYRPGRWFDGADHAGWRMDLEQFHVDWIRDPLAPGAGQPTTFASDVVVTPADGGDPVRATVEGNRPLVVDGMKIHQLDWGYAPLVEIVVDGQVVHSAFLTTVADEDGAFRGAAKAPAADPDVGLELELFPFAPDGDDGWPRLTGAPWDEAPLLVYHQWRGDLQLERTQQLITELDTDALDAAGVGFLRPGQEAQLAGVTVRFVELRRWVGFQVSTRPQIPWLLVGSALLVLGLVPALYAYRRRLWIVAHPGGGTGRTLVRIHGRSFQRADAFDEECGTFARALEERLARPRSRSGAGAVSSTEA